MILWVAIGVLAAVVLFLWLYAMAPEIPHEQHPRGDGN